MKTDITPTDSVCPIFLEPQDPAQVELDKATYEAKAKAETDKATAKQAVLDKLGLTADEVTALLG
jgi:hypothetical protein